MSKSQKSRINKEGRRQQEEEEDDQERTRNEGPYRIKK